MSKTEVNTKMMINLKEAAESLGISKMALRIRVSKGKFPQPDHRVGAELFWDADTLDGIVPVPERIETYLKSDIPF